MSRLKVIVQHGCNLKSNWSIIKVLSMLPGWLWMERMHAGNVFKPAHSAGWLINLLTSCVYWQCAHRSSGY